MSQSVQKRLFAPACIVCGTDLATCAARWHSPDGSSTAWESCHVCHNPACTLYRRAFPKDSYARAAKKHLRMEDADAS